METLILIVHYIVCVFLIIVILLQAGKGADMGAAFGGTSQTVFGSRGAATFLSKLTTAVAIIFLITSVSLASISRNKSKSSILKSVAPTASVPMATPGPAASPAAKAAPTEVKPIATPVVAPQASPAAAPKPETPAKKPEGKKPNG